MLIALVIVCVDIMMHNLALMIGSRATKSGLGACITAWRRTDYSKSWGILRVKWFWALRLCVSWYIWLLLLGGWYFIHLWCLKALHSAVGDVIRHTDCTCCMWKWTAISGPRIKSTPAEHRRKPTDEDRFSGISWWQSEGTSAEY